MKIPKGVAAVIIGGLLIALGCWIIFGETSLRQSHRMRVARKHLPAITNAVYADSSFRDVRFGISTGSGGSLVLLGVVESEQNLVELKRVVDALQVPVNIVYRVNVVERLEAKPVR